VRFEYLVSQEGKISGRHGVRNFLAKAKRSGIKDVLLGKVLIPKFTS
jgi:hypothetical protein